MTTTANPDGQTPAQAPQQQSDAAGEDSGSTTDWRNQADVVKAFKSRDEAKQKARALESELNELKQKFAAIEAEKMRASGDISGLVESEKKAREQAANEAAELRRQLEERTRQDRRREIVDAILDAAHPQHKDALRLMLPGLHESGDVDLYAEDTKGEGRKSLEKLRKRLPAYFTPDGTGPGASPRAPGRDFANVDWMQLSPEEQRSVSDEDFRKHFAGRGRRAAGSSALFGSTTTNRRK